MSSLLPGPGAICGCHIMKSVLVQNMETPLKSGNKTEWRFCLAQPLCAGLFPLFQDVEGFGDKGASALIRAGILDVFVQAPARALPVLSRGTARINGAAEKIQQTVCLNRQGGAAGVVEQKQPLFQVLKKHLVSNRLNVRIGQKVLPGFPQVSAGMALLKHRAFMPDSSKRYNPKARISAIQVWRSCKRPGRLLTGASFMAQASSWFL
jgi:hypothetical protein